MTRLFNPLKEGMSPEGVETCYHIVLTQKLVQEAKLDRIKKELAVVACAIEDGELTDFKQIKNGMMNLIAYIEVKVKPEDELDVDLKSMDLVKKHFEWVKEYETRNLRNKKKN